MKGFASKGRGAAAVLLVLIALAASPAFAEDGDPAARIIPPGGVASTQPAPDEPTFLDRVWIWITSLA